MLKHPLPDRVREHGEYTLWKYVARTSSFHKLYRTTQFDALGEKKSLLWTVYQGVPADVCSCQARQTETITDLYCKNKTALCQLSTRDELLRA